MRKRFHHEMEDANPPLNDITLRERVSQWEVTPEEIASMSEWDVSEVTTMEGLFAEGRGRRWFRSPDHLPDLSRWNLSKVQNMARMFESCSNVPNVTLWDVSNVTTFFRMFAACSNFDQPLAGWNVSNGTNFSYMFYGCLKFNQPLTRWDVSNGTDFSHMFHSCHKFDQPLNHWGTKLGNALTMESMFEKCINFNQPLKNWNVSKVESFKSMFSECWKFHQQLEHWDVRSAVTIAGMFRDCKTFDQPLNAWGPKLTQLEMLENVFSGCMAFNQPLDAWSPSVGKVISLNGVFLNAWKFNQPLASWDVSNVVTMEHTFFCSSEFNQPLEDWDVSKVTKMEYMFFGCSKFNQPLGRWDVRNVTTMDGMFGRCVKFNQSLVHWDVSHVTTMENMFEAVRYQQPLMSWRLSRPLPNLRGLFGTDYNYIYRQECIASWGLEDEGVIADLGGVNEDEDEDEDDWVETQPNHFAVVENASTWLGEGEQQQQQQQQPRPVEPEWEESLFDVEDRTEQPLRSALFQPTGEPRDVILFMVKTRAAHTYQPVVLDKKILSDKVLLPLGTLTDEIFEEMLQKTKIEINGEVQFDFALLPVFMKWVMIRPMDENHAFLHLDFTSNIPNLLVPLPLVAHTSLRGISVFYETKRHSIHAVNLTEKYHAGYRHNLSFSLVEFQPCESWTSAPASRLPPPPPPTSSPEQPPSTTIDILVGSNPSFAMNETATVGDLARHLLGGSTSPSDKVALKFVKGTYMYWVKKNGEVDQMQWQPASHAFVFIATVTDRTLRDLVGDPSSRKLHLTLQRVPQSAAGPRRSKLHSRKP